MASVIIASMDWRFHLEAREILRRDGGMQCVGSADTVDELLRDVAAMVPDILLLDAQLPGGDGAPILARVRAQSPPTKILLFLDLLDQRQIIDAIDHGAEGCVLKASAPEHWLHAMRVVLGGGVWIGRRLLFDALLHRLHGESLRPNPLAAKLAKLTRREREIVSGVQRGLSNKQIARRLDICPTTVKTHLQHIFGKLGISGRAQLLLARAGDGWDAAVALAPGSSKVQVGNFPHSQSA